MLVKKVYNFLRHRFLFDICGELGIGLDGKIEGIRNQYEGRRCFITATGPSLTPKDLEMISGEISFGVNGIFLIYDKTAWRPDFYVCTDAPYFRKMAEAYSVDASTLCKRALFLNGDSEDMKEQINAPSNTYYLPFSPWNRIYDFEHYKFQGDISKGMYAFGTVTNIVIAIAMYMGFTEIYLIGADCRDLNKHVVDDVTDKEKDDAYVKRVVETQLKGYRLMKMEAEKRGVEIFNATRGGALEVFKRIKLEHVLSGLD